MFFSENYLKYMLNVQPKNIFQVNYSYFDKYNNEKPIQNQKPVPHNITCMMYIRNNVKYM